MFKTTGRISLLFSVLAAFMIFGCSSGGGGCSGCGMQKLDGPFPKDDLANRAVQVRLAKPAFDFLSNNGQKLVETLLPGGLSFVVPKIQQEVDLTLFTLTITICRDTCPIKGTIKSLTFEMTEPDTIKLNLTADVTGEASVAHEWWPKFNCILPINIKDKPVSAVAKFGVSQPDGYLNFDVSGVSVSLQGSDFEMNNCAIDFLFNWDPVKNLIADQINNLLKGQIDTLLSGQLSKFKCLACDFYGAGCPGGSTCNNDKLCADDKGVCLANPLGMVGKLELSSLLGSFIPGMESTLDLAVIAGQKDPPAQDKIVEAGGVALKVWAGVDGSRDACVPVTPPPAMPAGGIPRADFGNVAAVCTSCDPVAPVCPEGTVCSPDYRKCLLPDGSCPIGETMAAIGIHDYLLSKVLWSAFNSGALCISVGSNLAPDILSSELLGVAFFVSEVGELTFKEKRPIVVALKPQDPPRLKLGEGKVKYDKDGNPSLEKPLLVLSIKNLSIDFYTIISERMTRVFTITVDLSVPAGLELAPIKDKPGVMGLLPVLGDLKSAITNFRMSNAELFTPDTPEYVESRFPDILGSLLGMVVGQLKLSAIEIPEIQGLVLDLQGVRGEVPYAAGTAPEWCTAADGCMQFLDLYARIGIPPPKTPVAPVTNAAVASVEAPRQELLMKGARSLVRIDVSANDPGREYQYSVDGSAWSLFRPGPVITIDSPFMALGGKHRVTVRSRALGQSATLDMTGAVVEVEVGPRPPIIIDVPAVPEAPEADISGDGDNSAPADATQGESHGGWGCSVAGLSAEI
ncbi:MAG: hypothetical protein WC889_06135 [Myxococcota bacterium]